VIDQPRRFTFDRQGRTMPPVSNTRRSGTARKYVTVTAEQILNRCYPGEVPAVVIERALRVLVERDGRQLPGRRP
jgi:hypothetical protein